MLKNEPTLAIGGVDPEQNEHCEVLPLSVYRSPRCLTLSAFLSQKVNELKILEYTDVLGRRMYEQADVVEL